MHTALASRLIPAALTAVLALAGCRSTPHAEPPAGGGTASAIALPDRGELVRRTVRAAALESNLLGDSPDRSVSIYLPPSYGVAPERRYPVMYILHGYGGTDDVWFSERGRGFRLRATLDSLMTAGDVPELIVVAPDARNAYGGSFYTNSSVTGGWETWIARELVQLVDAEYRTLAEPAHRAIVGHSMGGHGALKLAMRNPDVYGAVYAMSACCMRPPGGPSPIYAQLAAVPSLDSLRGTGFYGMITAAMGAAFAPRPGRAPFQLAYPYEPGPDGRVAPVPDALAEWRANAPLAMFGQHVAALRGMRGIALDAGNEDDFRDIPPTARAFADSLTAAGIAHRYEAYTGDHSNRIASRLGSVVVPWVAAVIDAPSPR